MLYGVVVDFGKKTTITKVDLAKKSFSCLSQFVIDRSAAFFLDNPEALKGFLHELSEQYLNQNTIPLVVTISSFDYVYYRTDVVSKETFLSYDSKMKPYEKEEAILENLKLLKPAGLNYLSDDVTACCLYSSSDATDLFISAAYVSEKIIRRLCHITEGLGINLLGVMPFMYGIFNVYMAKGYQLIFKFEDAYMLMNEFGLIVWEKVDGYSDEDVKNFLADEAKKIYGIPPTEYKLVLADLRDKSYLSPYAAGEFANFEALAAVGCFMQHKDLTAEDISIDREEARHGFGDSLRKLFREKTSRKSKL